MRGRSHARQRGGGRRVRSGITQDKTRRKNHHRAASQHRYRLRDTRARDRSGRSGSGSGAAGMRHMAHGPAGAGPRPRLGSRRLSTRRAGNDATRDVCGFNILLSCNSHGDRTGVATQPRGAGGIRPGSDTRAHNVRPRWGCRPELYSLWLPSPHTRLSSADVIDRG